MSTISTHLEKSPHDAHSGLAASKEDTLALGQTDCKKEDLTEEEKNIDHSYQPRTAFGAQLMALRRAYIESGGTLLDADAFEIELRKRRGDI